MSDLSKSIRERAYLQGSQDKGIELNTRHTREIEELKVELNRQHLQDKEELNRKFQQEKEESHRNYLQDLVDITSTFLGLGFSLEKSLEMTKVPEEYRTTVITMLQKQH